VGRSWKDRARTATCSLTDTAGHDASSLGEMLIADVHKVFCGEDHNNRDPAERVSSADLTNRLVQMEGRPWGEWKAGKPLSPNGLARQLKMFKIQPTTMRLEDGSVLKGYRYLDFMSVFDSYGLLPIVTPLQCSNDGHFGGVQTVTPEVNVTVGEVEKVNNDGLCNGVTVDVAQSEEATWTV
jgi:uncharacterized protein DUF3631